MQSLLEESKASFGKTVITNCNFLKIVIRPQYRNLSNPSRHGSNRKKVDHTNKTMQNLNNRKKNTEWTRSKINIWLMSMSVKQCLSLLIYLKCEIKTCNSQYMRRFRHSQISYFCFHKALSKSMLSGVIDRYLCRVELSMAERPWYPAQKNWGCDAFYRMQPEQ